MRWLMLADRASRLPRKRARLDLGHQRRGGDQEAAADQ
jgi:hypothetical protein